MNDNKEIVPGLTFADVNDIADQIFSRKDENHPHCLNGEKSGLIDILENAEPDISASPIFIN